MRLFLLCLLTVLLSSSVHAADTIWSPIPIVAWKGKQAGPGKYDLAEGLVQTDIALAPVEGHWVRFGATARADAPDFLVWVFIYDAANQPISRYLPTVCELEGSLKRCHTTAWIRPGGTRLRLSFYSDFVPVEISPGKVEWARAQAASADNLARYAALRTTVQQRYFRSAEVDWTMSPLERGALDAPEGIDPLPHALRDLIGRLPENKHTQIIVDNPSAPLTMPLVLPSCAKRADGAWQLRLPATPQKSSDNGRYIDAAHACLAGAASAHWVVDMRAHGGGNTMVTFAALAPIFGTGNMMQYQYPDQSPLMLALTPDAVTVAESVNVPWEKKTVPFAGSAAFLLGPGCMSACESVAIAVKGKYKTMGQPTGGFTTVNDTIRINAQMQVALTNGMQADAVGRRYEKVTPDQALNEQQMAAAEAGQP